MMHRLFSACILWNYLWQIVDERGRSPQLKWKFLDDLHFVRNDDGGDQRDEDQQKEFIFNARKALPKISCRLSGTPWRTIIKSINQITETYQKLWNPPRLISTSKQLLSEFTPQKLALRNNTKRKHKLCYFQAWEPDTKRNKLGPGWVRRLILAGK